MSGIILSLHEVQAILAGATQIRREVADVFHPDTLGFELRDKTYWMPVDKFGRILGQAVEPIFGKADEVMFAKEEFWHDTKLNRAFFADNGYVIFENGAGFCTVMTCTPNWTPELREQYYGRHSDFVKTPASEMLPWASRLMFVTVHTCMQRLQDMTELDALKEGAAQVLLHDPANPSPPVYSYRMGFADKWDAHHPDYGTRWSDNPWTLVAEIQRQGVFSS